MLFHSAVQIIFYFLKIYGLSACTSLPRLTKLLVT